MTAPLAREAEGAVVSVPVVPTEEMWGGLARAIIMWMDMHPKTPRALFLHLERSGHDVPQWLRDEPEMKNLDHVPSKGTRAVIVYRAMIDAAPTDAQTQCAAIIEECAGRLDGYAGGHYMAKSCAAELRSMIGGGDGRQFW